MSLINAYRHRKNNINKLCKKEAAAISTSTGISTTNANK